MQIYKICIFPCTITDYYSRMDKRVTINDVASAAGVSKGTVDRVLHNRPEVSKATAERVMRIIEEMGFKPNINASLLAQGERRSIVCILPQHKKGEVWELWDNGIEMARDYADRYGISIDSVMYDQYDLSSYDEVCADVLTREPAGVILAPMFNVGTIKFTRQLRAEGIPYIYIDTKTDDDGYFGFFGMPMYQSGYLAGHLLAMRCPADIREVVNVRILRDSRNLSDPTLMRRTGFRNYINEHLPECKVREVFINPKSEKEIREVLDAQLLPSVAKGPVYIVVFNSRVHLLAAYIRERSLTGKCHIIGFDSLSKNIDAVRDGSVDVLVAQHCDLQMNKAVHALVDYLTFGLDLQRRDNYTQMDILNSINCDYYD